MIEKAVFCLQGSLIDLINRQIPNFLRPSPVWLEKVVNGGIQTYPVSAYHPAIYADDGSFLLEPSRTNRLTWGKDFSQSDWIKGSKVVVFPDEILAADGTYQASKIAFVGGTGAEVSLKRNLLLKANTDHVLSILFSQEEGSVASITDIIRVSGNVVGSPSASITSLGSQIGKYELLELSFKTSGTGTSYSANVLLEFYIESIVVLNISMIQVEEGLFRTSLIPQEETMTTRQQSTLVYRKNPIYDAKNCGIFVSVSDWKGNGNIVNAGNLSIAISNGKLVTQAGAVTYTHIPLLPPSFDVFVQVSQENLNFSTYVNNILVNQQSISTFTGSSDPLSMTSDGLRRIGRVIITDKTLLDTQKTIGQPAKDEVYTLFSDSVVIDSSMLGAELPIITLPEVTIPANTAGNSYRKASCRFPFSPSAQQSIVSIDINAKKITVGSASSFVPGKAIVQTFLSEDVAEVTITSVDEQAKFLIVNSVDGLLPQHLIAQARDETLISPSNYYAGILTPIDGVRILDSYINGVSVINSTESEVKCTPFIRVYL